MPSAKIKQPGSRIVSNVLIENPEPTATWCQAAGNATAKVRRKETKIATPGGTTTITTETDVKKTGEKPPGTTP